MTYEVVGEDTVESISEAATLLGPADEPLLILRTDVLFFLPKIPPSSGIEMDVVRKFHPETGHDN